MRNNVHANLHYVDENVLVYPAGHNVVKYSIDSKLQEFINGSDGTLAITTVAVSASKRYVPRTAGHAYMYTVLRVRVCCTRRGALGSPSPQSPHA